jgi:hypothetical protein
MNYRPNWFEARQSERVQDFPETPEFAALVLGVLREKPHGMLIKSIARALELAGLSYHHVYQRLYDWYRLHNAGLYGLGCRQFGTQGRDVRFYRLDEPFSMPSLEEHQREQKRIRQRKERERIVGHGSHLQINGRFAYERPRPAIHYCRECCGLAHRRPKGRACACGGTYQPEPGLRADGDRRVW